MSTEFQVTFDAGDPDALCRFWVEALHYRMQPPPPGFDTWDAFLESVGVPEDQRNTASAALPLEGETGPRLFFQQVPEGKSAKNRVHLDLRAAPGLSGDERMRALEAECERMVALGATRVQRFEPDLPMSGGHIVMQDPEGNEFCLD
jgi:hypothetical protein